MNLAKIKDLRKKTTNKIKLLLRLYKKKMSNNKMVPILKQKAIMEVK